MPSQAKRMMHLGAFVHETGQHVAAWRHPDAHYHSGVRFQDMVEVAQLAERGRMDFLFLADSAAVDLEGSPCAHAARTAAGRGSGRRGGSLESAPNEALRAPRGPRT